jgi:hypothetical protein
MEERFLLDRIALQRADIVAWNEQCPVAIEPHPANAVVSGKNQTPVTACVAAHLAIG